MKNSKMYFMDVFTTGRFARLQKFSDACLRTEDGSTFPVHKVILASHNNYFKALFRGNFNVEKDVLIRSIDSQTLNDILIYIYTGRIAFDVENILNMLIFSDYFLDDKLMEECKLFAVDTMTTSNCLSLFNVAWKCEWMGILSDCYRFVQVHFDDILYNPTADIGDLPFEALQKLLGDKSLNVAGERDIWMAIITWIEKKLPDRLSYVPNLINLLSLEDMDEELAKDIVLHPFIQNNPVWEYVSKSSGTFLWKFKCFLSYIQNSAFSISRYPEHLHLVSVDYNESIEISLSYDDKLDIWRQICTVQMSLNEMVLSGQYIYMFDTNENRCAAFNIIEKSWFTPSSDNMPRFKYSVVEVEGTIYILGGYLFGVSEATDYVEVYNLDTDTWQDVSRMSLMNTYAAVSMEGKIYAFGDTFNGHEFIMVAQVYNPSSDEWTILTSPRVFRRDFSAVVYKGHIYLIGGNNGGISVTNVEQYNPYGDLWVDFPDLPFPYLITQAIVLQDTMIVYDSHTMDTEHYKTNPPFYWDEYESCWKAFVSDFSVDNIYLFRFCQVDDAEIIKDLTKENRRPEVRWQNNSLFN